MLLSFWYVWFEFEYRTAGCRIQQKCQWSETDKGEKEKKKKK